VGTRGLCQPAGRIDHADTKEGLVLIAFTYAPTFDATIYVGFHERDTGRLHTLTEAESVCSAYCDEVGLCVTVTPTKYVYTGGQEPGCIVGLIHYPRFPHQCPAVAIRDHAFALAKRLLVALGQQRVSVVLPDRTAMLTDERKVGESCSTST
jgi:hypothetical protein